MVTSTLDGLLMMIYECWFPILLIILYKERGARPSCKAFRKESTESKRILGPASHHGDCHLLNYKDINQRYNRHHTMSCSLLANSMCDSMY